jgi:hypothetical protein
VLGKLTDIDSLQVSSYYTFLYSTFTRGITLPHRAPYMYKRADTFKCILYSP